MASFVQNTQKSFFGGPAGNNVGEESELSQAVKVGQRSSSNFKQAWHMYCESKNQSFFDPTRHNNQFIQDFFDSLGTGYVQLMNGKVDTTPSYGGIQRNNNNSMQNQGPYSTRGGNTRAGKGGILNASPDSPLRKIQELVKMGQRNCPEWKQMWIEWCSTNGNGIQDPARHSSLFILSFVLKFGLASVVGSSWAQSYLVSLGELAKPYMTRTISRGCEECDSWNELWGNFADGKGVDLRDPTKHDAGSLMEFFDMTAMVQFPDKSWMMCYKTGDEDAHARNLI